jgi:uncharacterized protein YwqG
LESEAKLDKRLAEVIWTTAREQGTPDVVVESALGSLLPSIRLAPQHPKAGEDERLGGCRIGGVPDLPQGVEWPRLSTEARSNVVPASSVGAPLSFLLQVNLAEVAFVDLEQLLPKSGMLYFFFHLDEIGVDDVATVLFAQSTELRRTMAPLDLPANQLYRGFNLAPSLEWTVPSPFDLGLTDHLELWDELEDRVAAVQGYESPSTYGPGYAVHRLLGHAQFIQAQGMGEVERLLLQVSSDAGLSSYGCPETGIGATWHDSGRIYYIISEESLKSHRIAEAFVNVECA